MIWANFSYSVSGVDIVLNHRLVETGFGDKKGFTAYLKAYMKKVLGYLEENDRKDEIAEFKSNINNVMKEMMGKFKDLQFYTGKITSHSQWLKIFEKVSLYIASEASHVYILRGQKFI